MKICKRESAKRRDVKIEFVRVFINQRHVFATTLTKVLVQRKADGRLNTLVCDGLPL